MDSGQDLLFLIDECLAELKIDVKKLLSFTFHSASVKRKNFSGFPGLFV